MINLKEIENEIRKLENEELSYQNIQKLSWLYTVYDHAGRTITGVSGNEFLDSCNGCDKDKFFDVLSEHFDAIKVLHPKEYQAVLRKLNKS